MTRGAKALAAADYDAARHAYAFAYDTKSSDAALDGMHRAQAQAIAGQLDGASSAVAAGKYLEADRMLREVQLLDPKNPRLATIRAGARKKLLDAMSERVADQQADPRKAYELVKLARQLYSDAPEPEYALVTLRERQLAKARDEAAKGNYGAARQSVALVKEMEPWEATVTSKLDQKIADSWADTFVSKAKAVRHSEPGLAAVLYARAYEIAKRPQDIAASHSLYQTAAAEGPVAVYVDNGAPGEAYVLKKAVVTAIQGVPGTSAGNASHWDLLAKVYTTPPTCHETREAQPLTKDYIAGQRQVPNPKYVSTKKAYDAAQVAADKAVAKVDAIVPNEEKAAAEATRLEIEGKAKQRDLEDMNSVLQTTKSQIDKWEKDVKTVQDEIAALPPNDQVKREDAQERLKMTRQYADQWRAKLKRDQEGQATAQAAVKAANARTADAKTKAQKLAADRQAAETARSAARQKVGTLQAQLAPLPKTVMEDVHKTLKYDNVKWTDTCTAKVAVYLGTRWKPKPDSPQRFEVTRTTSDQSHIGFAKAGIKADPKQYPVSQHDMLAQMRTESEQRLDSMLTGMVNGYFSSTLQQAFGTMKADQAADVLTSMYAGAATRMDTATRQKYGKFLTDHYGLEKLATLAPEPPPPPMEPTPTTATNTAGDSSGQEAKASAAPAPAEKSSSPASDHEQSGSPATHSSSSEPNKS